MPIDITNVNADFHQRRSRCTCKAWEYSHWTLFRYDSFVNAYNDPQHRVKPDPLDETDLPKQYKKRVRPAVIPWTFAGNYPYNCSGCGGSPLDQQWKGIAETAPVFPSYSLDWQAKVLDHISEQYTNIGDSLAEYRATASQFYAFGVGIKNAWRKYKGLKKFKNKRITPCSVTSAELAYSFGIKPLAEDLFSSVEALRLKLESPIYVDFFKTATAFGRDDSPFGGSQWKDHSRRYRVSNRVEGTVRLKPVVLHNLAFGNPVSWGWELLPFSFVIDWGIPIGQYLQHLDMIRRIESVRGTRSIKEQYTSYARFEATDIYANVRTSSLSKLSYKSHERKKLTSIPVPPLPRWKPSISWHKVYRALTLLVAVNQPCRKIPPRIIRFG